MDDLQRAVLDGYAYRASKRHTLDDGQEFVVHIDPDPDAGPVAVETPAVEPPQICDIDVWENADPGTSLVDDLFVHNMNYGVASDREEPTATVQRVATGGLDTTVSAADKTEETRLKAGGDYNTPGGASARGIWRKIPADETISFIITDRSGGAGNVYGFDTVIYEEANFI